MSEELDQLKSDFLEQVNRLESLESDIKLVREMLTATMKKLGVGTYVQDPYSLCVHKVEVPKGRYVFYQELDYVRTALEGESRGSLSKKEAESQGFKLI